MPVSESNNPIVAETTNIGSELAAESTSDPVSPTVTETDVDTAVVSVPSPPPNERKKVDFTTDIASKALIESIAPVMDDFKIENLMEVLPQIIQHVQTFKNLTGTQKKNMIVSMLRHLVDITDGPGDDELWDPIIKRLLPGMVDMLVKVDQGKLKLNTNPCRSVLGIFSCCRP
jgi:hypothetical protein